MKKKTLLSLAALTFTTALFAQMVDSPMPQPPPFAYNTLGNLTFTEPIYNPNQQIKTITSLKNPQV